MLLANIYLAEVW